MPLLTIITITYNAERYLERTLRSVQKALVRINDPGLVEYWIIDGASKDNTLALAHKYREVLSLRIQSEPDRGLYDAMNKGLEAATGKYLWFLNAGDEVHDEEVLQKLLAALESKADVYYSDALFVRDDGSPVGLRSQVTPHTLPTRLSWRDMALGMKVSHQAFIPKRELAPRYDITNLSADIEWEIMCLKKARTIQYLELVLCRYLTGGLSVQRHRRSLLDRFTVLRRHFGLLPTLWNHVRISWRGMLFARKRSRYWSP
ncbi:glycosyltransferase family 2 protein [Telluribacter sp.]|jgi:glycosyltransferase involved in cell wall biosynthesis|uniref:glycosyltransferase family 2 protein n=1 Tax=Telluribacter sp. TaxID=1978767 RepID=UPI002E12281D|nr:glycosyltransferase family 2 protein [Telluribacter sp.]